MSKDTSYRQILRSYYIIGGASVINIIVGLVRIKFAAVLLGPAGVGLIGLLTSLASTAAAVASMGISNVGTRQIAEAAGRSDTIAISAARRAVFWGALVLALAGAGAFWVFRNLTAVHVLGDGRLAGDVGWLALAVALMVATSSQTALLNGMRRIGDLARISVLSALVATFLGVTALLLYGNTGLIAFVIAGPLASFAVGHFYISRLPKIHGPHTPLPVLFEQWRVLIRLGGAFMVAGLVATLGQLAVRTLVQKELGADALGYFQAASAISVTYIGFILTAMGTDYYPRLTAAITNHVEVNRMVNQQTEVALLLAGPIFLAMIALAPWMLELLYSDNFQPATNVLRLQILADILKIASWPLGFVLLAAGAGRTVMLTEFISVSILVGFTSYGIPFFGVAAAGAAFVGMYLIYLPLVYYLAHYRTGFHWNKNIWFLLGLLLTSASTILFLSLWTVKTSALSGVILCLCFGTYSYCKLKSK